MNVREDAHVGQNAATGKKPELDAELGQVGPLELVVFTDLSSLGIAESLLVVFLGSTVELSHTDTVDEREDAEYEANTKRHAETIRVIDGRYDVTVDNGAESGDR